MTATAAPDADGSSALVDTTDASGRATGIRLQSLDALRGVAVLFVVVQHFCEGTIPAVRRFTATQVQFGQLGVTIFFLCSGFIIPAALERNSSLKSFGLNRFFRLYPMFWVSLIGAAVVAATHEHYAQALTNADWLANATMLQSYLGAPHAIPLYWSLEFELAFYAVMAVLFAIGMHRRTVELQALAQLGCIALALGLPALLDRHAPLGIFNIATMFTGTLIYRYTTGAVSRAALIRGLVLAALAGVTVLGTALWGNDLLFDDGTHRFGPMLAAWVIAYVLFLLGLLIWRSGAPAPIRWLGLISYSVYLIHALVIVTVPASDSPAVTVTVWAAVTVLVSWCTYRIVERPSIRVGRDIVRRRTAPSRAAAEPA